jgi:hypothetical protein
VGAANNLIFLDQCLVDGESLIRYTKILDRINKCCLAIKQNMNLADICNEQGNFEALARIFGQDEVDVGFQILVKLALSDHSCRSFSLNKDIQDPKKLLFIQKQVSAWRQFDTVLTFQIPALPPSESFLLINPLKQIHWKNIKNLAKGTLISVYVKMTGKSRSYSQEILAAEKYFTIFDMIQNRTSLEVDAMPVVQLNRETPHAPPRPKPAMRQSTAPRMGSAMPGQIPADAKPVASTKVVVNKIDVMIHAGNAQLILAHCKDYPGRVVLYVQREVKKKIQLDADSIWSAEIRNGETVIFEFFGPQPSDEFLKDLAKRVNKYTQMDKIQ